MPVSKTDCDRTRDILANKWCARALDICDQIHPLVCDGADYVNRSTETTSALIFQNKIEHARTTPYKAVGVGSLTAMNYIAPANSNLGWHDTYNVYV